MSVVDGNIVNSKGVHVGVVLSDEIFGLKGQKLYDLKGSNIYKLNGDLDDRFHETGIDEAMIDGTGSMLVDSSFGKC
jgi:hypothetical protein